VRESVYTAFDRYTKMAEQSLARVQGAQQSLAAFHVQLKPSDPTEKQLRDFHQVYDAVHGRTVESASHSTHFDRPAVPTYSDFCRPHAERARGICWWRSRSCSRSRGQAHIRFHAGGVHRHHRLRCWRSPSGPHFFGASEQRWVSASAGLDGLDDQVFVRDFLRKMTPTVRGMARVESAALTPRGANSFVYCSCGAADRWIDKLAVSSNVQPCARHKQ